MNQLDKYTEFNIIFDDGITFKSHSLAWRLAGRY